MTSKLLSLELHGYKTFASRTTFEFPGSVTAIVGPNGSGKSNIADALRWVLGEQSFSLMRGKKTEDMIFSGSEQRSRAGMASATVVFDNSDRWLPVDYTEVAIARRAYRDGSNEYLINGQRVRLKDVAELLAESGLAERTYTIIGQGLVDAALSLKAEERRKLFEEAAGIGLFRSRREESIRRLEATNRNLERVEDILSELKPRLNSLEKQAKRAEEFERVKAELREYLREWYGHHWHRIQTEVTEAIEAARKRAAELDAARHLQSNLDKELSQKRSRLQSIRELIHELHRKSSRLHLERETIDRGLAVSEERLMAYQERERLAHPQMTELEEEIGQLMAKLDQFRHEEERFGIELVEARNQKDAIETEFRIWQEESGAVQEELERTREKNVQTAARLEFLHARLKEIRSQEKAKRSGFESVEQGILAAQSDLDAIKVELDSKDQTQRQTERARLKIEQEIGDIGKRLNLLKSKIQEKEKELGSRVSEIAGLEAQLDVLMQAEQSLAGYPSGVKLLISASKQKKLKGSYGTLGSYIKVKNGYEVAISAALGEYLDAVLVEDDASVDDALYLIEGQPVRVALIPMNRILQLAAIEITEEDGDLIGPAMDLITIREEFRKAVELVLANTIVVRDRKTALKVLTAINQDRRQQQAVNLKLVTLLGEIFFLQGQVTAGLESSSGTLIRSAQMDEKNKSLANLRREEDLIKQSYQELQDQLLEFQQIESKLRVDLQLAREKEEKVKSLFFEDQFALEKLKSKLNWQIEERTRISEEIHSYREQIESIEAEVIELKKSMSDGDRKISILSEKFATYLASQHQTDLAHWDTEFAILESALREVGTRSLEVQQRLIVNRKRATEQQSEYELLVQNQSNLNSDIEKKRHVRLEIAKELDSLQDQIEPAESELQENERDQAELQAKESRARQELNRSEHLHAQARITLAKRQESLDGLRRRIEDDFGLVAFEYAEEVSGPTPLPLEGMVEELPVIQKITPELEEAIKRQRSLMRRMGPINPEARKEYIEVQDRYRFLTEQMLDLQKAATDVRQVIGELDGMMVRQFRSTFDAVVDEFHQIFSRLFAGGSARLRMTDPEDLTNTGIEIEARLPGRREQGLSLLSGGERSLSAVALVFALLRVSPTPFCVLDEVDAMLDEANVGRFGDLLKELSQTTQFILITHNRATVQVADVIYGVTMGRDSTSQMISLRMDQVEKTVSPN